MVNVSLISAAVRSGWVVSIHFAESPAEIELLENRRGAFVPFLQELGVWEPKGLALSIDWICRRMGPGARPVLFIHGNYLPPDTPIPPNGTVVYCPRTHAAFRHPPHPFREFLKRGARVALVTDSLA